MTTEGFRDVYEIGRINRPDAYNLFFQKHVPLIERALCFEVKERVRADGEVVTRSTRRAWPRSATVWTSSASKPTAIMFINCYANGEHEARAKAI